MRMQKRPDAEEVRRTRDFYDWWAPFYDATNWLAARLRGASIAEMARVTRPGGKVVICDPGLPYDRPARWINRQMLKLQPAYAAPPPVRHLPAHAENVEVSWIRGEGWYLLEFTKSIDGA